MVTKVFLPATYDEQWDVHINPVRNDIKANPGTDQPDIQTRVGQSAGVVGGFDSASHYLPSLQAQQERRQALPDRARLRAALEQASKGLPFREGTFEPFLEGVERAKSGPPLTLEKLRDAGLAWRLEPLVFQQDGDWVGLIVPRGVTNPGPLRDFVAERQGESLSYLDLKEGSERLVADFRREALGWLAVGAAIAVVMLFLGLRSARRILRVMTPVALAVLLTEKDTTRRS